MAIPASTNSIVNGVGVGEGSGGVGEGVAQDPAVLK